MRIVQVANFVTPTSGGLRTTLGHLAAGYAALGHDVVQILPGAADGETTTEWGQQIVLRAPALGATGYRLVRDVRRLRAVLDSLSPDAVEVHDRTTLRGLGHWARDRGVPSMVVSHERLDRWLHQWLPGWLPLGALADRSNAALARSFDAVVCTTEWAAAEFRKLDAPRLAVVPLAVDRENFRCRIEPLPTAGEPGHGGPVLIMASRLSREKRPETAVATLRELLRRGVPARLVVAGDGPLRRQLEARSAGLPVDWLGFVRDRSRLAGLLAGADVALAPGPIETFGLAALEALACGTPVVADARSALPGVLGSSAGRAAAGSGAAFADAVEDLLAVPEADRRRAAAVRSADFSWSATVAGFLAVHADLLGAPA